MPKRGDIESAKDILEAVVRIESGYAVCDAAMRKYVVPSAPAPKGWPYPKYGLG